MNEVPSSRQCHACGIPFHEPFPRSADSLVRAIQCADASSEATVQAFKVRLASGILTLTLGAGESRAKGLPGLPPGTDRNAALDQRDIQFWKQPASWDLLVAGGA
jgi:hypothetical protein